MTLLAVAQRQQQIAVRAALTHRLLTIWPALDPKRIDKTFPAWLAAVTPQVQDARAASALVAARYLRDVRAKAGVPGQVPLLMASAAPLDQISASMSATAVASIYKALGAGHSIDQAMRTGFVASSGAASRIALQGGRDTIVGTVRADQHAAGWERVAGPNACDFCSMLADRGAVYREDTVDFEAHDHCACVAEPLYR